MQQLLIYAGKGCSPLWKLVYGIAISLVLIPTPLVEYVCLLYHELVMPFRV